MERKPLILKTLTLISLLSVILFVLFYKQEPLETVTRPTSTVQAEEPSEPAFQKMYRETIIKSYEPDPNWQPVQTQLVVNQPQISGEAAILIDLKTGNTIFERNSRERKKIASVTKIMTAVVALEHKPLDTKMKVSARADKIGENSMELNEGEIYTLNELLHGLILHSGNDAAFAIAENTAGSVENFIKWMNMKAKELGLSDTYFADPSGLNDATYSTPADLVKLTRYAMKDATFRKVVKTIKYEISATNEHPYKLLENQTNLVSSYPGVAGVKTGYTEAAGLCLVTYASNDGQEVIGVVLNSTDRKGDMITMLDYGFSKLGVNVVHNLY